MLEGDLAELIDRRWQARLFEKEDNVRVAALVFHRRQAQGGARTVLVRRRSAAGRLQQPPDARRVLPREKGDEGFMLALAFGRGEGYPKPVTYGLKRSRGAAL